MSNTDTKKLFLEVTHLHDANVTNAQKTAENAIKIGILLHQIKETVGHGNFLPAMAEHAKTISQQCCSNYMRLATERMIEEKARLLISDQAENTKLPTVGNLPADGKSTTVSDLVPFPEHAIPADAYEQARKEVLEMKWLSLPKKSEESIVKNISGKDLMDLYRQYGIVRAKSLKVYHPPKKLTPDEKIEAENQQAEELLLAAERALAIIGMDLSSKTGILAARIKPSRWKEFLRNTVVVTKAARPLVKRKASPAEKLADRKSKTKALPVGKKEKCHNCQSPSVLAYCSACGGRYCIECSAAAAHKCNQSLVKRWQAAKEKAAQNTKAIDMEKL